MNWSDEKYVKLFTRDTLTWKTWPWESRALFALLIRKVDGAGLLETGNMDPAQAVALQVDMPISVVSVGLPGLLELGTVERVKGGICIVNFIRAQESTKTEARKKQDQRQRAQDQRRSQAIELLRSHVPQCPDLSTACPPPAQPSPAQPPTTSPIKIAGEKPPALFDLEAAPVKVKPTKAPKAKPKKPPTDPRHAPTLKAIADAFLSARGAAMWIDGRVAKDLENLLARAEPDEVLRRWGLALGEPKYPKVATLGELASAWEHWAGQRVANVVDLRRPQPPSTFSEARAVEDF